jgi:hypothetical protein
MRHPPYWTLLSATIGLLVFVGLAFWFFLVRPYVIYIPYDPVKAIQYLESQYHVRFPSGIQDIRIGVISKLSDGTQSFVMRFVASPGQLDELKDSASAKYFNIPYNNAASEPIRCDRTPNWFRRPIVSGDQTLIEVSKPGDKYCARLTLYVDTSNPEAYTVYIMGLYSAGSRR